MVSFSFVVSTDWRSPRNAENAVFWIGLFLLYFKEIFIFYVVTFPTDQNSFKNGLTANVTFGLCFQAEDADEWQPNKVL